MINQSPKACYGETVVYTHYYYHIIDINNLLLHTLLYKHIKNTTDHFDYTRLRMHLSSGKTLLSELSSLLARVQSNNLGLRSLLNLLISLSDVDLDVRGAGLVSVDTTMSTVSTTALLRSLVDLDVGDDERLSVEALGISVGTGVLQKLGNKLDGLDGPSGLGDVELLALSGSADTASKSSEGNSTLLLRDSLEVGKGLVDVPTADGDGGLVGVLERNTEVGTAGRGALSRVDRGRSVTSHCCL